MSLLDFFYQMTWIELTLSILSLSGFIAIYMLVHYTIQKHPKMYLHKPLFGFFPLGKDSTTFWKELFKSSIKKDRKYTFLLNQVRVILFLFFVLVIYWTYFSW